MHESGEMYLETVLLLKNEKGYVRSVDIARKLEFSKPSVSRAVGLLKKDGYITVDGSGYINLTDEGMEKANAILEKHRILTKFFVDVLNVSNEIAEDDACRIEHVISDTSFEAIKAYMNNK